MRSDDIAQLRNLLTQAILEQNRDDIYRILEQFIQAEYISILIHNANNYSLYGVYSDFAIDTRELDSTSLLGEAFRSKKAKLYGHIKSEKYNTPTKTNNQKSSLIQNRLK